MKRLDRVVIGEILGPWIFGVAIFTVLIMAGSFLFQFTEYVAKGISIGTVLWIVLLLMPGIMATTFPMAMLLGTLLAFGRLSGESEVTAMRAAGVSLVRIMIPVGAFGIAVALASFCFGEFVVPAASREAAGLRDQIARQIEGTALRPTSYFVMDRRQENGKTVAKVSAGIQALDFNLGARTLRGATLVAYDRNQKPSFFLHADELEYTDEQRWRIRGNARLTSVTGDYTVELKDGAWPEQITPPNFKPEDIFAQNLRDTNALSMRQISEQVELAREKPDVTPRQLYTLEKGFWDKVAIPMAAIVYALFGAPLGIRNHRSGAASGFAVAILIILAYYLLGNALFIAGQGGAYPAWAASFVPVVIGLAAAGYTIHVKNR